MCSLLNACGPDEVDVTMEPRLKKRSSLPPEEKQTVKSNKVPDEKVKRKRDKRQADLIRFAHIGDTHVENSYAEVCMYSIHESFFETECNG